MMKKLDKIKKVKLTAEVSRAIESYIEDNGLQEGEKLPSERVLTEQLGVGRSSLREALSSLAATGFVKVYPGKGIFVGKKEKFLESIVSLTEKKVTLLELLQVRKPLETLAAEMAAQNATKEMLNRINKKLDILLKSYNEGNENPNEDVEFHLAIHEASGNPVLPVLAKIVFDFWGRHDFGKENNFLETLPLHKPLFEAIFKGDEIEAVKAVKKIHVLTEKIIIKQQKT
jgi:GntR family transcriptional regulator, transcriptional repressor for pyruvate dehydrogenase complex